MNEFEQKLREALERREPPGGFAGRVIARARASEIPQVSIRRSGWFAAVAAVLMITLGLWLDSARLERAQGERAKEEVLLALRVTARTLDAVGERVRRAQPLRVRTVSDN